MLQLKSIVRKAVCPGKDKPLRLLNPFENELKIVPEIIWDKVIRVIIVRQSVVDVVFLRVFSIGETGLLREQLHLLPDIRAVHRAAAGRKEPAEILKCIVKHPPRPHGTA